jgi:hypothetical protein
MASSLTFSTRGSCSYLCFGSGHLRSCLILTSQLPSSRPHILDCLCLLSTPSASASLPQEKRTRQVRAPSRAKRGSEQRTKRFSIPHTRTLVFRTRVWAPNRAIKIIGRVVPTGRAQREGAVMRMARQWERNGLQPSSIVP